MLPAKSARMGRVSVKVVQTYIFPTSRATNVFNVRAIHLTLLVWLKVCLAKVGA
jgi:hypothetical protein